MARFEHYGRLRIESQRTAEYTFYGIRGEPTLTCRPAAQVNRGYFNAVLKDRRLLQRAGRGRMSEKMLREARESDLSAYPKYVITDWPRPPVDDAGEEVPYSEEACGEFLRAIPEDMFDDLRAYCGDLGNFRDEDELDEDDAEDLAGN